MYKLQRVFFFLKKKYEKGKYDERNDVANVEKNKRKRMGNAKPANK